MIRHTWRALCWLVWIGLLTAGLWPFNFFPKNRVAWIHPAGLSFDWNGIVYTRAPLQPGALEPRPTDGITVELVLKPAARNASYYAEIFSLYCPDRDSFAIGQLGSTLHINGNYSSPKSPGHTRGFAVPDALPPDRQRFVAVVAGTAGTFVYADRELIAGYPGVSPLPEMLSGRIVLGHSPGQYHPWVGELYGVSIYRRALASDSIENDYDSWAHGATARIASNADLAALFTFHEGQGRIVHDQVARGPELLIPRLFRSLQKQVLPPPSKTDYGDTTDVILNIAGFVPFGFLLAAYFRKFRHASAARSVLIAAGLCFATSLAIELLQVFLPSRTSSMADLINNVLGGFIGALLATSFQPRSPESALLHR